MGLDYVEQNQDEIVGSLQASTAVQFVHHHVFLLTAAMTIC